MGMGPIAAQIREKIMNRFAPVAFQLVDDSAKHHGHAGYDPRGETHFSLHLVSAAFEGLSRIERQRLVHAVLAEELAGRVHALALQLKTPQEVGR
jgi:BolA protein